MPAPRSAAQVFCAGEITPQACRLYEASWSDQGFLGSGTVVRNQSVDAKTCQPSCPGFQPQSLVSNPKCLEIK